MVEYIGGDIMMVFISSMRKQKRIKQGIGILLLKIRMY